MPIITISGCRLGGGKDNENEKEKEGVGRIGRQGVKRERLGNERSGQEKRLEKFTTDFVSTRRENISLQKTPS